MDKKKETIETLSEIRSMMERSTRFISLNGLSGVFAGIIALLGAYEAQLHIISIQNQYNNPEVAQTTSVYAFFFIDAAIVLIASISIALILSYRKAKKQGLKIWDSTAKRLVINLLIPLFTGGIFCMVLLHHGLIGLIAPATLIFYGLALINASKYTVNDIRYLGITELTLGLIASVYIGYGLLFWAIGFGVCHIIYGGIMYFKYEK